MDDITSSGSDYCIGAMGRHSQPAPSRVINLTSTLQDTNKNLRKVDKMLENYKDLGEQQASAMDKLRDDLLRTSERLKEEKWRKSHKESRISGRPPTGNPHSQTRRRFPTSPLKDYDYEHAASDYDERDTLSPGRRRLNHGGVRFYDDMDANESVHELHQSLRDLNSGHLRMEDDLNREITRRNKFEHDSARVLKDVAESLKRTSVEERLDTIQNELQREKQILHQNQDDVGQLSSQLHQALSESKGTLNKDEEMVLRNQVAKTQNEKTLVLTELDKTRRKLELSEGSKTFMLQQIEDLRKQLVRTEDEKLKLQEKMERQDQYLKRQQVEGREKDFFERERLRLEEEVKDLRLQLTKSASALGDIGGLHKELDRSERQRQQLSDHIQVLQKELDDGERQSCKVLKSLQEMTDAYNTAEGQRQQLEAQLKDSLKKLKDTGRQTESLSDDLKDSQLMLHDSQHKREEMKIRAQETIKQWKAKCKKQEKEIGVLRITGQQTSARCDQLTKELEVSRQQAVQYSQQVDVLRREFNQLIAIRAQQEEDVRIKDIQVNELKSFRADLERDLRDCKAVIERMEHELHTVKEKGASIMEEKIKTEEHLNNMQQGQLISQNQLHHLQKEVKELSLVRVELTAKLAEAANERSELRAKVKEARHNEASIREEMDILIKRIKEDKKVKKSRMQAINNELNQYRHGEIHSVENINRQRKKEFAEYHANIQAMKVELEAEKSSGKLLKKQNSKLKSEVDRINSELANNQEDLSEAQRKYRMVREEYLSRSQLTEDGLSRAKEIELELLDTKEAARRSAKDHTNILHTIAAEIDGVIEVAAMDSIETYKALALTKNPAEPNGVLAEVKSKLSWLKQELREMRQKENRICGNIKEVVLNSEKDRNLLMAEIERQSEALEQLAFQRQKADIAERDLHNLSSSVLQVEDLAPTTETHRINPEGDTQQMFLPENNTINDSILMKTQEEREKIHERYSRLQDTMNALRQEIFAEKKYSDVRKGNRSSNQGTPNERHSRRVRISSPPSRQFSPSRASSASPTRHTVSPSRNTSNGRTPLALNDEEFQHMFVPKSPKKYLLQEGEPH